MSWFYDQSTGRIYRNGSILTVGYSGNGKGKNNPKAEAEHNVGPIPQGEWEISAPHDTPTHGPYVMTLTPAKDTDTKGRSGFLIHGDSIPHPGDASQGCVILPRFARERIWESGDHILWVVSGEPVADVLGGVD